VGIAIAMITTETVEEMISQPGCPNLYWALTNLPSPFMPLDKGIEGERLAMLAAFRPLDPSAPMTAQELKPFVAQLDQVLQLADEQTIAKSGGVRKWLDARANDAGKLAAARQRLLEYGFDQKLLSRFPADQVILLDEKREYEVRRDDIMKYVHLPAWQFDPLVSKKQKAGDQALFAELVPAFATVCRAQARLDQRLALVRHVEALRMYAAEHRGALPPALAYISVPLPVDPFSGKPFRYEVRDDTAHLRGCPPRGEEKTAVFNLHYEVTLGRSASVSE
jgi:hypothetical protein